MFHLKYPKKSDFFNWVELECLARALGYNSHIFKENITDEIIYTTEGVTLTEMLKMIEYKILQSVLHLTFNMHTADWNMCLIKKCLILLNHKALMFEEIHSIRLSYETYEAIDMKGMVLNKHILLRAIKMCGRMIAPMKLMHRIKHMRDEFDEKGRIQLYEFLELILWCDLYEKFYCDFRGTANIKENKLFQLVDFEKVLSHHDEKIHKDLNSQYLQDEWDFGQEKLGSKRLFKDPTVHTEDSIRRTTYHKEDYKHLKSEVATSQKQVHQARAGFVRPRPVTAPQLSHYRRKFSQQTMTERSVAETYKIVQRRLRSAPARSSKIVLPERPKTCDYYRKPTPCIVTSTDIIDLYLKKQSLNFDITTVKTRAEENGNDDLDYLLPGYREKRSRQPKQQERVEEPVKEKKPTKNTEEVLENLSQPKLRHYKQHHKSCDARHRGWYDVGRKKGPQRILINLPFNEGPNGLFMKRLQEQAENGDPKNYIYRYTKKHQYQPTKGHPKYRPYTAPASTSHSDLTTESCSSQSGDSDKLLHAVHEKLLNVEKDVSTESLPNSVSDVAETEEQPRYPSPSKFPKTTSPTLSPYFSKTPSPVDVPDLSKDLPDSNRKSPPRKNPVISEIDYPNPYMKHTKPKIVEVGHIGRIKLLESIQESKDLEELLYEPDCKLIKVQSLSNGPEFEGDKPPEKCPGSKPHSKKLDGLLQLSDKYSVKHPDSIQEDAEDVSVVPSKETIECSSQGNPEPKEQKDLPPYIRPGSKDEILPSDFKNQLNGEDLTSDLYTKNFKNSNTKSQEEPENILTSSSPKMLEKLTEPQVKHVMAKPKPKVQAWICDNQPCKDMSSALEVKGKAKEIGMDSVSMCHQYISTGRKPVAKIRSYKRLAERVQNPSTYVHKCLLSASS
ncbi:hypothetical protein LOTGIDRAFT_236732 [Lottia gigantea]|uniref:Uncharacterized protein n=1 Tax=Lottia gigantea TaxID=225164 RepID=V3ZQX0_LOTGI|nr:hypothetical protein LOTGIDRAFT_236732 [Lottia gigantea]ESO83291.1 hypothetical protein LOTGIDRAFT_236732 [Lottia gigantea]